MTAGVRRHAGRRAISPESGCRDREAEKRNRRSIDLSDRAEHFEHDDNARESGDGDGERVLQNVRSAAAGDEGADTSPVRHVQRDKDQEVGHASDQRT